MQNSAIMQYKTPTTTYRIVVRYPKDCPKNQIKKIQLYDIAISIKLAELKPFTSSHNASKQHDYQL